MIGRNRCFARHYIAIEFDYAYPITDISNVAPPEVRCAASSLWREAVSWAEPYVVTYKVAYESLYPGCQHLTLRVNGKFLKHLNDIKIYK